MKVDLCKLFGVEEGEEFRVNTRKLRYCVLNNTLMYWSETTRKFEISSGMYVNELTNIEDIIKLPKKKEFTDDELCILRNIDSEYNWVARSSCENTLLIFAKKPVKNDLKSWSAVGKNTLFNAYNHLFQSIQWEDEEPVYIDDYVERGVE